MPPQKIGIQTGTYSTLEDINRAFYESCLDPVIANLEEELTKKLISTSQQGNYCIRFKTDVLGSVTFKDKVESFRSMAMGGMATANELRGKLGLPRIDNEEYDKLYVASGTLPLDMASYQAEKQMKKQADNRLNNKPNE